MCSSKKNFVDTLKSNKYINETDKKIILEYLDKLMTKFNYLCVNPNYLIYKLHMITYPDFELPVEVVCIGTKYERTNNYKKLFKNFDEKYKYLHLDDILKEF